jgi:hypothetical protein
MFSASAHNEETDMTRTTTKMMGAGVLLASLAIPLSASADPGDEVVAFVAGAAVGHLISGADARVYHVHGRGYHRGHYRGYQPRVYRGLPKRGHWRPQHYRHPAHGYRQSYRYNLESRHGRGHDRRSDRRDDRRHDRRDGRHRG